MITRMAKFRRAFIEITNRCNLACVFCAPSRRPAEDMSPKLFERAAAQAKPLAEMVSLHLLGEPLLHPRFPEILAACARLGLRVNLVTNGLLLDSYPPEVFAEPCLDQISISLHALACLPEGERPGRLSRLAAFAKARRAGLTIGFRLRSGGKDAFLAAAVKELLAAFGAGAAPGADYVKLADGVFLNFGGFFDWPGGEAGRPRAGCLGLRHHFGVLSDGRVVPCCADYDGAMALGNIKDAPLGEILAGERAAALRRSIAGTVPMPGYCSSCGFSAPDA